MINLKQLIVEGKKVKYEFRNVLPGGIDASVQVEFQVNSYDNKLVVLPKTSKDLDKINTLNLYREDIGVLLENRINDSFKEVEFNYDKTYQGAGYGFVVNLENLVKKLK